MSKLQNDFTTRQQSRKLLALGMSRLSANFYYDDENEVQIVRDPEFELQSKGYFPCWSVGRLIEIYHICVGPGCSFTFHVCFPNLMHEVIYKLGEAHRNGWLNLSKLEE